jgi:hypothetical protein
MDHRTAGTGSDEEAHVAPPAEEIEELWHRARIGNLREIPDREHGAAGMIATVDMRNHYGGALHGYILNHLSDFRSVRI